MESVTVEVCSGDDELLRPLDFVSEADHDSELLKDLDLLPSLVVVGDEDMEALKLSSSVMVPNEWVDEKDTEVLREMDDSAVDEGLDESVAEDDLERSSLGVLDVVHERDAVTSAVCDPLLTLSDDSPEALREFDWDNDFVFDFDTSEVGVADIDDDDVVEVSIDCDAETDRDPVRDRVTESEELSSFEPDNERLELVLRSELLDGESV
jgi:hypothetical protein